MKKISQRRSWYSRMNELRGKLRQKSKNGAYYYRLMIANNVRKEFALKTHDYEEARQKAADLDGIWDAPTQEVAIAQINAIKGFSKQALSIPFDEVWRRYELHPNRAMPHTVSEQKSYRTTSDTGVFPVGQKLPLGT